ncbi:MAG TPA: DUF6602 domain-containing protein [Candidatus Wunengus sp. YC64]|uniref:DUF6602 domain-containing protein n=1 Tax=Candidatus Wunengus sp. YC64 TaxID=3367700 RepID=UPI004029EA6D
MSQYLYNDFIKKLSERFKEHLNKIEVEYNFEYGDEFETALCRLLRSTLPNKYGICRGFVVDAGGEKAGDDIILYAQDRFPTLRQGLGLDFSIKEQIPIEAAYAYVETKYTLVLKGESPSSLQKAVKQVERVKELCSRREPVELSSFDPYVENLIKVNPSLEYQIRNPMYGVILAHQVRLESKSEILSNPEQINAFLIEALKSLELNKYYAPDLIITGDSNIVTPAVLRQDGLCTYSQFFSEGKSFGTRVVQDVAFGIGLMCLFFALDWIRLGKLPWKEIFSDALQIPIVYPK